MCGITGFLNIVPGLDFKVLERMNREIIRRGPDDEGYYMDDHVGLAMRRLSIIDLASGKQPIFNEDKSVCVVFNGEIYNYKILREQLIEKGHTFCTKSDSEVIVHAYEEYGDKFVDKLRGMFAIALWDMNRRRLLLVRDRVGIKPLFYSCVNNTILFGSEIKCLLKAGIIDRDIDYEAFDCFFTFGYIPAPNTIYRNVRKLKPGHMLICEKNGIKEDTYWDADFSINLDYSEQDWIEALDEKINEAVKLHMISDVEVGAFLSGGIDSSLVVAMMAIGEKRSYETFTMGFGGESSSILDEKKYARRISHMYHTSHNEYIVEPDFRGIINEIISSFDEPFADDSVIPTYYVCKETSKKVKVALSGLGGDELFGGYHRYAGFKLGMLYEHIPETVHEKIILNLVKRIKESENSKDYINHLKRFLRGAKKDPSRRYFGYVSILDSKGKQKLYAPDVGKRINQNGAYALYKELFDYITGNNDMNSVFYTDYKTYLPDDILTLSDRLSMWHSLELRVPLVDHELLELVSTMPDKYKVRRMNKKYLLKKIAEKYLPSDVIHHRKQGFESPMASWLRKDLKKYAYDLLLESDVSNNGFFNKDYIKVILDEHVSGVGRNNKIIFSLIMFNLWANHNKIKMS